MKIEGSLGETSHGREDFIGTLGPDERFGIRVMRIDELANRGFELRDAAMRPAPQLFVGQFSEPPLDQIQPRPVGRREMHVKAWTLGQPVSNQRVLCVP